MNDNNNSINLNYIGHIESPFKEKFAIPRQPGLVNAAKGKVILTGDTNNADLVKELAQFSHIWLLFIFHGTQTQGWKPLVRPPRLGGNKKMGVLATRSTFRPNPIGMSVVKLTSVEINNQQVILHISGIDLLDQTPIIDIKPYIPYSDALPDATAGFAQTQPDINLSVMFSQAAQLSLTKYELEYKGLTQLIEQVLAQDPRPAYKRDKPDDKVYGMSLHDLNIEWQMQDLTSLCVTKIAKSSKVASVNNEHKQ